MIQEEMLFKGISHLALWPPFCSAKPYHLCNFGRGYHEEQFCEIILNLDQWIRRRWVLKKLSYLELWWPLWVELNHLCNFGRRHHEEHFCEIILNLDQWFMRKCCLKIFFIWSSGGPFVQRSGTICAISVEGIMRNNSVKLFRIWASGSGDVV